MTINKYLPNSILGFYKKHFISKRFIHLEENLYFDLFQLKKKKLHPNLFIIGAQKSGTTSLHRYLDYHPNIFMSKPIKEPGFFIEEQRIQRYWKRKNIPYFSKNTFLKNYMLQGYWNESFIGESSTFYTNGQFNRANKVPLSIKESCSNPKFIYILRNPFERIQSHYLHEKRKGKNEQTFEVFCQTHSEALEISLYGKQLQKFKENFSKEDFLILFFDDLIHQPQKVLNQVFSFLGEKEFSLPSIAFKKHNESENKPEADLVFSKTIYSSFYSNISKDLDLLQQIIPNKLPKWNLSAEKWRNQNR